MLATTLPPGVSLSVHEHLEEHYEARHIPDPFVEGLKEELSSMEEEDAEKKERSAAKKELKDQKRKETLLASLQDDEEDF